MHPAVQNAPNAQTVRLATALAVLLSQFHLPSVSRWEIREDDDLDAQLCGHMFARQPEHEVRALLTHWAETIAGHVTSDELDNGATCISATGTFLGVSVRVWSHVRPERRTPPD